MLPSSHKRPAGETQGRCPELADVFRRYGEATETLIACPLSSQSDAGVSVCGLKNSEGI